MRANGRDPAVVAETKGVDADSACEINVLIAVQVVAGGVFSVVNGDWESAVERMIYSSSRCFNISKLVIFLPNIREACHSLLLHKPVQQTVVKMGLVLAYPLNLFRKHRADALVREHLYQDGMGDTPVYHKFLDTVPDRAAPYLGIMPPLIIPVY